MPNLNLDTLTLAKGGHASREQGVCLMEAAAWLAGQPHTDHPPCVSPVLGAFGRSLNDVLPDDTRQLLKPLIRPMLGTAGDGKDEARGYLALDWLVRTYLPAWLDLAGIEHGISALAPVMDLEIARAAGPVVRAARDKASAARDAAGAAAWDAAGAAAWDAAGAAAWDAARAAARDAAGAAAWDAAGAAAGAAAWAKLTPTVAILQADAIRLYGVMIDA